MGYFGDWGNLQRNMDRVKDNIASKREHASKHSWGKKEFSEAAKNRKSFSLVNQRRKDITRVRLIYLMLLIAAILIFYFLL